MASKPLTKNAALTKIANIVSAWEHGGRLSTNAMNDVYLVIRQLEEEREQKKK